MSTPTAKEQVIEMIQRMPDSATVVDIMAELYVRQQVDEGLRQLDNNESLSHDEVKQRMQRWLG